MVEGIDKNPDFTVIQWIHLLKPCTVSHKCAQSLWQLHLKKEKNNIEYKEMLATIYLTSY